MSQLKPQTARPGAGANPQLARAMADKRRSSAAGPHDPRPNRQRARSAARRAAINDAS